MADILKDKTQRALFSMSVPISLGMLSTFLFQIVDTYLVGQLGTDALAALSFSSTLFFLLVGLFMGLSVGVSIIVGQAKGAGDDEKAYTTVRIGGLICLGLSILLSGLAIAFIDPTFTALGAPAELLLPIRMYTVPILAGIPLLNMGLLIGGVLRATGNVTKPEVLMGIAGVINLVFDYGLIFGKWGLPELGLQGAAFATVLSWIFVFMGMVYLLVKDNLLRFSSTNKYSSSKIAAEIRQLSVPTIVTQIIGPLTLMYLTFLLAQQTPLAVAAYGVAGRIETLLMIGILAVSTATTPFIAQNQGAQQGSRIEEAIVFGGKSATYIGILICIALYLGIRPLAGIFSDNGEVVGYTADYFYIVSLSYVFYSLFIISTAIFNGLKMTAKSLRLSIVKSFVFTIPLTLIGSFWGVVGIFIGVAVANVLAGFYAAFHTRRLERELFPELAKVNIWQDYLSDLRRVLGRRSK